MTEDIDLNVPSRGHRARWLDRFHRVVSRWRNIVKDLGADWQIRIKRVRALAPASAGAVILAPFAAVLDLTAPGRDVVTTTFEGATFGISGANTGEVGHFVCLALSLAMCALALWVTARLAVVTAFGANTTDWPQASRPAWWVASRDHWGLWWYLWMPRLLAATPFVIIVIPLFNASEVNNAIPWVLLALLALFFVTLIARRRFRNPTYDSRRAVATLAVTAGIGFAMLLVFAFFPVTFARALGAPAIGLAAVAFLVATLALLYRLLQFPAEVVTSQSASGPQVFSGQIRFLPLGLGLLGIALLASFVNDNHVVNSRRNRLIGPRVAAATDKPGPVTRLPLKNAFQLWLGQVPKAATTDAPIPIVFVATAGGASRAAYWTGVVLARIEERTGGQFGRHLFAISSVSGGTLGAAAYLAERAEGTAAADLAARMKAVNGADHLAPAIGALLFPDLLQRLIPYPLFVDRAEALERSFEADWKPGPGSDALACRGTPPTNRFAQPFLDMWKCTTTDNWVPALFVNGTRAEDGRRIVTSSLQLPAGTLRDAYDFHTVFEADVPLSVVVTNSARFPVVSPPGTLPRRAEGEISRGHIIDGGYFENGGITTLVEVASAVMATADVATRRRLRPIFIEINNDDTGDAQARYLRVAKARLITFPVGIARRTYLDAFLPVLGLYNSRSARGSQEALRVMGDWTASEPVRRPYHLFQLCPIRRNGRFFSTQMNWTLSRRTQQDLDNALSEPSLDPGCGWRAEVEAVRSEVLSAAPKIEISR